MIDTTLNPGTRLNGYVIEQAVGRGGFGAVYRARTPAGTTVALKVIDGRGGMERLLVEPEILARLSHPGIVRLLDYFVQDGSLVLAMEYVEGPTLEAYLRERGRIAAEEVRDMLVQIAHAIEHAHQRYVVHRDLKLSNILIDLSGPEPRFVLADFGVAHIVEGVQVRRRLGGSYHFMAPEQLRGRASDQSDLWALGVVAYIALSGRRPFEGASLDELTHNVFYETPPAPSRLGVAASAEFDDLVLRLLEKQLENRTATATEFLKQLGHTSTAPAIASPVGNPHTTWEKGTERSVQRCLALGIVTAILAVLPNQLVSGLLQIVCGATVLKAYRRRPVSSRTFCIAVVISALALALSLVERPLIDSYVLSRVFGSLSWIMMMPLSAYFLGEASRMKRELSLVRSVRENAGAPDALLKALKGLMQEHPGDDTVHIRYVEALFSAGRHREAVVEAKLVRHRDPYNIGAGILLAHAYFELGLHVLCVQVCDEYLEMTHYAFEFSDLRRRALRRGDV